MLTAAICTVQEPAGTVAAHWFQASAAAAYFRWAKRSRARRRAAAGVLPRGAPASVPGATEGGDMEEGAVGEGALAAGGTCARAALVAPAAARGSDGPGAAP